MKTIIRLLLACMLVLMAHQASAQIEVRVAPVRRDFMLGEAISVNITLTNMTDQEVTFTNTPGRPWLHMGLTTSGQPVAPRALAKYPSISLSPGSTRSFQADIRPYYNINREGAYRLVATVRMPDMRSTYSSNGALFNVTSGGTFRSFNIQARGQRLRMNVKTLNIDRKDCFFGQVVNADTNVVVGATFMARYLNFMKPKILLDRAQNLHLLCQSTPEYFTYAILRTDGSLGSYKLFTRTGGPVDLISTGAGIRTIGLTPYVSPDKNPKRYHSTSDRPF